MQSNSRVAVTASFYVHHQDAQGDVSHGQRVSCVDITEELLSLSLRQLHQLAQSPYSILSQLQSFSLEREQYEAISHCSIALDDPMAVLRLFGFSPGAPSLGKLADLSQASLDTVRTQYGFERREFEVQVAQVRRCVKTIKVVATNQFEAGEKAMAKAKGADDSFDYHEEEFFVDEVTDCQDTGNQMSNTEGVNRDLISALH